MVMPSSGPRKPRRRASKALCVTRPAAIRSKAASAGATGPCARAWPFEKRASISLQPPQPGTRPMRVSGSPMASSAWAWIAWQCSRSSQPPPSARPAAAPTTGMAAYFTALKTRWPWSIRSPKPSGPASTAARNCRMSAPALKAGASEPITSARKSCVARASAASSADRTDGFRVFILLRISKQATPSPRSQRLACSHASTGGPASRSAASVSTPGASATLRREPSGNRQRRARSSTV